MFELIELDGGPHERGFRYGRQAAASIRENAHLYLQLIEYQTAMAPEATRNAAIAHRPILEAYAPELLEEMCAIAAGAGCDLADVLLINCRSELMSTSSCGTADECTALGASPPATRGKAVLLAQNWDWYSALGPPVLLHIRQPGRPEIFTLCEAGQVGKIGLNSAGLGVCLNFLSHRDENRAQHLDHGPGLPIHVLLRQMLENADLGGAVQAALRGPRGGSANVLVGHAAGDVVDLELTPFDADFLYSHGGWLVHANHYESVRLRAGDVGLALSRSTIARAARARSLLEERLGSVDVQVLQAILTNHAYSPYGICRHPDPGEPPLEQTATRASVVMDLGARSFLVSEGVPCQAPFRHYSPV